MSDWSKKRQKIKLFWYVSSKNEDVRIGKYM